MIDEKIFKNRIDIGTDFSCAFLLTYDNTCEKLHGHNFQVAIELEGYLQKDWLLFDYREIKKIVREICKQLDEHTLIPLANPNFIIIDLGQDYEIQYSTKKYRIPKDDTILIDLPNLSSEMLAYYFCKKVVSQIENNKYANLTAISIEIKEKPGQSAIYREVIRHGINSK